MATTELRHRAPPPGTEAAAAATTATPTKKEDATANPDSKTFHPAGRPKYGRIVSFLRLVGLFIFWMTGCLTVHATQILGAPLYLLNREFYYAYQSLAKASFGLLITTMTNWWAPTLIRVSGDASVAGQLKKTKDGRVQCDFPERLVLIANHQIYTDWIYLWWVAYTNSPQMHGHIYIILKESLRWIPVLGPGCMFLSFIFMSRKISVDRPRLAHRLGKLKTERIGPDGEPYLNPMWLLLFPEGTNLSDNGRIKSAAWAKKQGLEDHEHLMIPRSTGTYFCLKELEGTVDYVYDCAVAYEGIPRGQFGEDHFGLLSTYVEGRPPKSVNFHWRRFKVADIPLDKGPEVFDEWIRARWTEKDQLMEYYMVNGRFPADDAAGGLIETEVRTENWWEFLNIFTMLGAFGLTFNLLLRYISTMAKHFRPEEVTS